MSEPQNNVRLEKASVSAGMNRHRKRKWKRAQKSFPREPRKHVQQDDEHESEIEPSTDSASKVRRRSAYHQNGFHGSNTNETSKKAQETECLKETDVGITEYITDYKFFGILKARYTDFHVNEIDLKGRVSKLTNQNVPAKTGVNVDIEVLKQQLPEAIWNQLGKLHETDLLTLLPLEIDVTNCSKSQRQTVHTCVKMFAKERKLASTTIDKESKKVIVIQETRNSHSQRDRERINWQEYGGEWCRFVLHKLNVHTMTAIIQMASVLRIKPNKFCFAGTKDRRGCTTQWFTLWKVHPSNILRAARHTRGVYVGNFEFVKEPLHLGQLSGNHFKIALRNISDADQEIEKAMISLQTNGFINYFGLQRFGAYASVPSYAIGIALLQGRWEKAIELILTPKDGEEEEDLTEAKKIYQCGGNAHEAYGKIENTSTIEAELLKGICVCGKSNPQGALDWTPKNMRTMYMHSYQSLVWNHMVSKRIKELGKNPVVGDLVYAEENTEHYQDAACDNDWQDEILYQDDNQGADTTEVEPKDSSEAPAESNGAVGERENITEKNGGKSHKRQIPSVRILREEDLSRYTLADVIMPTPGNSIVYPPYAKPWFEEFLAKDNLTTSLQQKSIRYSLPGNYRKILQIPTNLSWKIVRHKTMTSDLLRSDINEMRGLEQPKDDPDGTYKSLIIEMSLKASTYATMALREILTCGTSKQEQTAHSKAYYVAEAPTENTQCSTSTLNTCNTSENCLPVSAVLGTQNLLENT